MRSFVFRCLALFGVLFWGVAHAGPPLDEGGEIPDLAYDALRVASGHAGKSIDIAAFEGGRFVRVVRGLVKYNARWRETLMRDGQPAADCFWLRGAMLATRARLAFIQSPDEAPIDTTQVRDLSARLQDLESRYRDQCGPGGRGGSGGALWTTTGGAVQWLEGQAIHGSRLDHLAHALQPYALGALLAGVEVSRVMEGGPIGCRSCQPADAMPSLLGAAIVALMASGDEVDAAVLLREATAQ